MTTQKNLINSRLKNKSSKQWNYKDHRTHVQYSCWRDYCRASESMSGIIKQHKTYENGQASVKANKENHGRLQHISFSCVRTLRILIVDIQKDDKWCFCLAGRDSHIYKGNNLIWSTWSVK